jgi:hypothetical protein
MSISGTSRPSATRRIYSWSQQEMIDTGQRPGLSFSDHAEHRGPRHLSRLSQL